MRSRDYEDGYDKALSEAAVSVQTMDEKLRDMERAFWTVVAASGGKMSVPRSLLMRFDNPTWEIRRDDANDCVVYSVKI
jgi:hypothetical protein